MPGGRARRRVRPRLQVHLPGRVPGRLRVRGGPRPQRRASATSTATCPASWRTWARPLPSYSTTADQASSVEYFITNPTKDTRVDLGEGRFEKPIHKYDAVEVTANRCFSNNWSLITSYRWSRADRATSRASSGTTTASATPPSRRCTTSRPTTRATPRSAGPAVRVPGRHPVPGLHAGRGAAAERPHAPVEALRQLHVRRA